MFPRKTRSIYFYTLPENVSYLLKTFKLHTVLNYSSQELVTFLTIPLQIFPNWRVASLFTSVGLNFSHFLCSHESEGFEFDVNIRQWMQTIICSSAWTNSSGHCVVNLPVSAVSNERSLCWSWDYTLQGALGMMNAQVSACCWPWTVRLQETLIWTKLMQFLLL